MFICDTPARAFLKCVKSHTGYFSCDHCEVEGEWHDTITFLEAEERPGDRPNPPTLVQTNHSELKARKNTIRVFTHFCSW